jgi:hypothetical protein
MDARLGSRCAEELFIREIRILLFIENISAARSRMCSSSITTGPGGAHRLIRSRHGANRRGLVTQTLREHLVSVLARRPGKHEKLQQAWVY